MEELTNYGGGISLFHYSTINNNMHNYFCHAKKINETFLMGYQKEEAICEEVDGIYYRIQVSCKSFNWKCPEGSLKKQDRSFRLRL